MRAPIRPALLWAVLAAASGCSQESRHDDGGPAIRSLVPASGPAGTLVAVEGERFGAAPGRLALAGSDVAPPDVLSWSDARILFWVPAGAADGDVVVSAAGRPSNGVPFDVTGPDPTPPERAGPAWAGALTGKRAVLSPGHGFYYDTGLSAWTTQRPDCWGLIEDRHTNELAIDFLIPMLERAGCLVLSARERSRQENEAIVDDGAGAPAYAEGELSPGLWQTSASPGLGWNGTDYRYATVAASETATASWRPAIPAAGAYPVYVWARAGSNRASDALYRVSHAGGVSEVRVDQKTLGSRWRHLGDFRFEPGTAGSITLSNASSDAGCVVVADAVRVGGGLGSLARGGSTSGRARWLECARMWTEFMGAPASVYEFGLEDRDEDITCRAHYADWMEDDWAGQGGAVYLSLHTNAAGTPNTGTGTDTFIHDTAPSPGSAAFQDVLHPQVVSDIRALWKSDWADRGQQTANFGELRETDDMPACLIEMAFHDTQTPDNDFLHEDEFRRDVARALYKGVSKYLNPAGAIAPLPPTHLRVESLPGCRVRVSWRARTDPLEASAAPSGYVVYRSADGRAFDDGHPVAGTSAEFARLTPGQVVYFRVAAANAGGESLPSEVLAARAAAESGPRVLIVGGFDRLDRNVTIRRGENTFDYVRQHAEALAAEGYSFDSAANEAVADGDVALASYAAADWLLGEESTADETFSAAEQAAVSAYLASGGRLLASGSEIAWDLGDRGSAADQAFLSGILHAAFRLDTPGSGIRTVEAVADSIFDGMGPVSFDDGTHGTYDVDWPDVLYASGGATEALRYAGGQGYAAGIAWDGGPGAGRLVLLGFPLEAVHDAPARAELFRRILGFLLP